MLMLMVIPHRHSQSRIQRRRNKRPTLSPPLYLNFVFKQECYVRKTKRQPIQVATSVKLVTDNCSHACLLFMLCDYRK